ncbi:MAG: hypothetical protein VX219_00235 [Actinomycetota bacterium]|nr:hypothetical protein [Actinomycetota bacterium]MEE3352598.1 hypothetical protein [Actinomycetota bacterium]
MRRIIGVAIIMLFFAVACSSNTRGSTTVPPTTSTADPTIAEPHEAAQLDSGPIGVPDELKFTATLIGGGTIDGRSLVGSDVLFWFWTPG